jgi:hypothetical protein
VHLLVGASGSGKSTTAWGLVRDDLAYLSDELAPIDLTTMRVLPYPRALCLKRDPGELPLPPDALDLCTAIYLAPYSFPKRPIHEPQPLARIFVLDPARGMGEPRMRPLAPAEASARVYPHALNALAHPGLGLDAVARVVGKVPCTLVVAGDIRPTCAALGAIIKRASRRPSESPHLSYEWGIDHEGA